MSIQYEWDENKAAENSSKHGVSFDEATTVFNDPLYVVFYDPDHSDDEQRYIITWIQLPSATGCWKNT